MSKYKPLYSSIWTDNQFENYSPEKKLVYIFLLTNQYVEKSGIYKVSVRQIAFNTSITNGLINDIINELINEDKIQYDFKEGIIFIKNLFKYQKGMIKNENILLLTLKRNYELVKTKFWNEFFNRYSEDSLASKINNLLIDGSLMAHQLYINNNNNKDKNINKGGMGEKPKTPKVEDMQQFESFWNLYDKKKSRPDAEKKFKAALKKDTFENIIAGLEKYIKARGSDAQYWKHPSTWLHQECWKDEHIQSNQQQAQAITHFATKLNRELGLNLFYSSTYTQNILTLKCFNKEALNQAFNLDEALKVKIRELCQSEYQSQPNIIC